MEQILSLVTEQQQVKKRLNIVFSISNLPQVYQNIKEVLYSLVKKGQIKSQSDLDRLTKWLNSQLKSNNQISQDEINQWLRSGTSEELFMNRLKEIEEQFGKQVDISKLSKQMREQFPGRDGKVIYSSIIKMFTNRQAKQSRQIWNKLSELKPRLLLYQTNTPQITKNHLEVTKGQLRFRFPPQPNGYLHIGHAKAIRINFQTALQKQGICYLRFDDTNPEKQSQEYIENIINQVRWMGYEPNKITYASDYFDSLLFYANELIKQGKAYVCQTSKELISQERKAKQQNPYRSKSKQYSLLKFPHLQPNETLRLKLDPKASNPTLRDPIIYRYKSSHHPKTKDKYKIYPTYDYAHCLCDSIEHIDYSLCSLEFEIRRELYYTILNLLNLYKPIVWEYSRLNIEGSLLSKRKITKLVETKQVDGWGDPRLMTLAGLKNRGYTSSMIINFVDKVNASRAGNENVVQSNVLTLEMKKELFQTAERTMVVLNPQEFNVPSLEQRQIQIPLFPFDTKKGFRRVKLTKKLYIQTDQNVEQGSLVGLKYIGIFRIVQRSPIVAEEIVSNQKTKSKVRYIHWVPSSSIPFTITQYHSLIKITPEGEEQYNKSNEQIFNALVPRDLDECKIYQFERLGYYKFYNKRLICCCKL